jgi:hypothetical protein
LRLDFASLDPIKEAKPRRAPEKIGFPRKVVREEVEDWRLGVVVNRIEATTADSTS